MNPRLAAPLALALLLIALAPAFARAVTPCTFVTDPRQIVFTDLAGVSGHLYGDVMDRKGLLNFAMRPPFDVAGKAIVKRKFRKLGIPDPKAAKLEYAVVAREDAARPDKIHAVVALRGAVDYPALVRSALEAHKRYMVGILRQGLVAKVRKPFEATLGDGKKAVVYPFADRDSEMLSVNFGDHTLISLAPVGDRSLLTDTVAFLEGRAPAEPQAETITWKVRFDLTEKEKRQILALKNGGSNFKERTRENFERLMEKAGAPVDPERMKTLEERIKERLVRLTGITYAVECRRGPENYGYKARFEGRCPSAEEAEALKTILVEQMVKGRSSCLSADDQEAYRGVKCWSEGDRLLFEGDVPPERTAQYRFVSMLVTLFFQDKRFTDWFHL